MDDKSLIGFWEFRRKCWEAARRKAIEHKRIELVVTIGSVVAAFIIALLNNEVVWKATVYALVSGLCAYAAIWMYFLILAPSELYDAAHARAIEAIADRDHIKASVNDIDEWEVADTILKRSIELGNQLREKCRPEYMNHDPMVEVSGNLIRWVSKTRNALERLNVKWAEQFSADGTVNMTGLKWPETGELVGGYVRRLEEIRETWYLRHPTKLRD